MCNSYNYLFIILVNYLLLRIFFFKACRRLIKVTMGSKNEKCTYKTVSCFKLMSKSFQWMLMYKQFYFCRSETVTYTHSKKVRNHGKNAEVVETGNKQLSILMVPFLNKRVKFICY